MNTKNKSLVFLALIVFLHLFTSCNEEITNPINSDELLNENQLFLREMSILLGKAIAEQEDMNELKDWMTQADDHGQLVSFAYLLGLEEHYKINELENSMNRNSRSKPYFLDRMENIFYDNQDDFLHLHKKVKLEKETGMSKRSSDARETFDYLTQLLASENYQIFYPYDPEFDDDDTSIPFYYTSYDPMNGESKNEGFLFASNTGDYEKVGVMTNDFLDNNHVFLIVPIEPCDLPGMPCDAIELSPGIVNPGGDLPPPANGEAVLLTYNVNHKYITDDNDMITSKIGKIRVKGTSWMGFGGTKQKLRFMRGAGEGAISFVDGQIIAAGLQYDVGPEIHIKRKYVKDKGEWVDFNHTFDADWLMTKNSQAFAVFSKHNLVFTKGKVNAGYQSGFKVGSDGKVEAHYNSSGSGELEMQIDAAKYRSKVELSRRQVLITNVGTNSTSTYTEDGIDFNVKTIGIIDFYFKHWHTSFAD